MGLPTSPISGNANRDGQQRPGARGEQPRQQVPQQRPAPAAPHPSARQHTELDDIFRDVDTTTNDDELFTALGVTPRKKADTSKEQPRQQPAQQRPTPQQRPQQQSRTPQQPQRPQEPDSRRGVPSSGERNLAPQTGTQRPGQQDAPSAPPQKQAPRRRAKGKPAADTTSRGIGERTSSPEFYDENGDGWTVDARTGKTYRFIPRAGLDTEGQPEVVVEIGDDLIAEANKFLPHLRA